MKINVIEYLEDSAKRFPRKIAFDDLKNKVSFSALYKYTQKIGTGLSQYNHQPIAIFMDKSVECLEVMYGVIATGNFYTIIDTKMPIDRIEKIFDTLNPVSIVTIKPLKDKLKELNFKNILFYEDLSETKINIKKLKEIREKAVDTDPIYTLFTSGSTGVPKGYTVNHKGVIDFVEQMAYTFNLTDKDIFANQSPLYFDLSINDVFGTIKNGNTMYLIPQSYFMFPVNLFKVLNEKKVDSIFWVPSALVLSAPALEAVKPKYLKRVLFCGEVMPNKQLNMWRKALPKTLYANLYGPAETVDASTYYIVNRKFKDDESLPIGKPFRNTKVLVIDENNKEVTKINEIGELCIAGSSLSMGYYNNPDKTKDAYVQNPTNSNYLETIYKTGDLVKYNERGELIYVSRKDYQIKHMGYRIELGEIETAIAAIDEIETQSCIYDDNKKQIVMFYTGQELQTKEIIDKLKSKLPNYMVPNVIIKLNEMPHNQNGKIDRKVLKERYMKGEIK